MKKVIAAEGEHKASRALRHAAEVITGNPAALQVVIKDHHHHLHHHQYHHHLHHHQYHHDNLSASLPSDFEQHIGREQQHNRLPRSDRYHFTSHGGGKKATVKK